MTKDIYEQWWNVEEIFAQALDLPTEKPTLDERLGRVVECRFFGGLSVEETAEVLGVSTRTVERDWKRAQIHLYRALRND